VVTVGADGSSTRLADALASITGASSTKRYVVRVAPGDYTETGHVLMKDYVDIEGSGPGITTLTCACGGIGNDADSSVLAFAGPALHTRVSGLSVVNSGGNSRSLGIHMANVAADTVVLADVAVTATGASSAGSANYAAFLSYSSPTLEHTTFTAMGAAQFDVGIYNSYSSPIVRWATTTASGATSENPGNVNAHSSPTITSVDTSGSGGSTWNSGVYNASESPRC
jgi:hypothetical protein